MADSRFARSAAASSNIDDDNVPEVLKQLMAAQKAGAGDGMGKLVSGLTLTGYVRRARTTESRGR